MNKISIAAKGLLLATLLVTSSAWAEWVKVGESDAVTFYIDPASLRKDGNMRKVWETQDLKERSEGGAMSSRLKKEYDCKRERLRVLAFSFHSEPMAGGEVIFIDSDVSIWHEIPPNTPAEINLQFVCAK